jgi:hypothetical protein
MNRWIKYLLIVLEVGGGFAGFSVLIVSLMNTGITASSWIFPIISGAMFLFGIVAGLALIERPRFGAVMSAVYQAFQIPILSSPLLTYTLVSGLQIGIGWFKVRLALFFQFGARSTLFIFRHNDPWIIGVNVSALALFVYLLLQLLPKTKATEPSSTNTNSSKII